jgi:hypothetical protein
MTRARCMFTADQRQELRRLDLFPEQIKQLEKEALPAISWRLRPPPRMADVRETLAGFLEALDRVEQLYVKMYMLGTRARVEAASRLDLAQEALGFDPTSHDGMDKLHDSLETATKIVRRALQDLPKIQRRTRLNSAQFVRKILGALHRGHAEHFDCSGYGDAPSRQPMKPFLIKVARKKPPFPQIVEIVSEASGGWSAEDAIRNHIELQREEQRIREELRKSGRLAPKKS